MPTAPASELRTVDTIRESGILRIGGCVSVSGDRMEAFAVESYVEQR